MVRGDNGVPRFVDRGGSALIVGDHGHGKDPGSSPGPVRTHHLGRNSSGMYALPEAWSLLIHQKGPCLPSTGEMPVRHLAISSTVLFADIRSPVPLRSANTTNARFMRPSRRRFRRSFNALALSEKSPSRFGDLRATISVTHSLAELGPFTRSSEKLINYSLHGGKEVEHSRITGLVGSRCGLVDRGATRSQ